MNILLFIIIIVVISGVIAPLAKGFAGQLSKSAPDSADLRRLAAELERTEQRLSETERRLSDAEERLDFQERLLTSRPPPGQLPPQE
jgi:hypothetical protein